MLHVVISKYQYQPAETSIELLHSGLHVHSETKHQLYFDSFTQFNTTSLDFLSLREKRAERGRAEADVKLIVFPLTVSLTVRLSLLLAVFLSASFLSLPNDNSEHHRFGTCSRSRRKIN